MCIRDTVKLARVQADSRTDWREPVDWKKVTRAQELLREYGDDMVEMGYLRK